MGGVIMRRLHNETMKIKMKTLRPVYYAGVDHKAGEIIDVQQELVKFLVAVKSAVVVEDEQKPGKRNEYKRRDLRAE